MTEHGFHLPSKVSPDVIAKFDALADRVCCELARTGLPVYRGDREGGPNSRPGAEVHVDPIAPGGVLVDWSTGEELREAALNLFAQGIDFSNPPAVVRHHKDVLTYMYDVVRGILTSAGFEVEVADGHTYGGAIHVKGFQS